jgi:hypothetical protein
MAYKIRNQGKYLGVCRGGLARQENISDNSDSDEHDREVLLKISLNNIEKPF